jgi:hypothetical protein
MKRIALSWAGAKRSEDKPRRCWAEAMFRIFRGHGWNTIESGKRQADSACAVASVHRMNARLKALADESAEIFSSKEKGTY